MNRQFKFLRLALLTACLVLIQATGFSQQRILIHSHNDYRQRAPFYQAYAWQLASVEADLYAVGNRLLVAHDPAELASAPTFDELYLEPIVKVFERNGERPWRGSEMTFTLLADLKTPAWVTLPLLVEKLSSYPEVFDPAVNPYAVRVVVSGNRPVPERFTDYPPFISFDGDRTDYPPCQLERVAMISLPFSDYADWNGKGTLKADELRRVTQTVDAVHALDKPIRFWGTPDGVTAWNTFHNMGVDYINTDMPELCADFFDRFENKNYHIGLDEDASGEIARAGRLDKTTVGFQGFNNRLLHLSQEVDVYMPTYASDGAESKARNVILLIGDGTGITQLQAGATANNAGYAKGNGLTIFNMKHIGLQNTSALDAYTTDSAAGGSALATGILHNNRHVSMSADGTPHLSMTDYAYDAGYACGVVTLGNIADATPAAFYGHTTERDYSDEITSYLPEGKLTLLCGAGMSVLTKRNDGRDLVGELKKQYRLSSAIGDINADNSKVICIDERMDLAAAEETLTLLADATREAIKKLTTTGGKGFFLMVEGAKIDYAGHANSFPGSVVETLSFDLAVAEALKFADADGETLVVVTGDHETGGLTLIDGDFNNGHLTVKYVTDDHTPLMLPVFAYGPGAAEFMGVYKNIEVFHKIKAAMGL